MKNDFSRYTSRELLQLTTNENDRELAYDALQALFKRWERGIDVSHLIEFIETDDVQKRLRGTYFLFEVSPRIDSVKDNVLKLADDPLAECRRAFVGYLLESGWYDDIAAVGLVNGIEDFDIRVRLRVIEWAITTSDERFADFSARVTAAATTDAAPRRRLVVLLKQRGHRALEIATRLRGGESVAEVRAGTQDEDGFTFDHLGVLEKHYPRRRQRSRERQERHPEGQGLYGWD